MRRIVVGIQARMSSSRLPGKSLADLGGRPLIEWVVRRVRLARGVAGVYLLTSTEPSDDPLAEVAGTQCEVVRGNLQDVRSRYRVLLEATGATDLVRVTGDCPLIDGRLIDALIERQRDLLSEYCHVRAQPYYEHAYPNGMNAELFTRAAFERMMSLGGDDLRHREHVTLAVDEFPDAFRLGFLEPPAECDRPGYKLSVDRPEELDLVRRIFARLGPRAVDSGVADIVRVCDELLAAGRQP